MNPTPAPAAVDEVADICADLIRIDTTNTGDLATGKGERAAAEHVAGLLAEVGLEPEVIEPAPGRTNLVVRIEGSDPSRDALLVHGHLDVVPAEPAEWSVHPFSGEIKDGWVWGRGAIDMKDFDAITIALIRQWRHTGYVPPRDVVFAYTADEEAGSEYGADPLVYDHADLFEGCTEAIGEVGGFSVPISSDLRIYPIQTAEKAIDWLRLTATGRPGHGSMINEDNAVTALAEAVARLGRHKFPVRITTAVRDFLVHISQVFGVPIDPDSPELADPDAAEVAIAKLGPISSLVGATIRDTANPTGLTAGYKHNVIPSRASATVDCRTLPGRSDLFLAEVRALLGEEIGIEYAQRRPAVETSFDGPLVAAMVAALREEDPGARPVPYMLSGGTDAKAFARLGMRCFGFSPLQLPAGVDFAAMFHGIDERVPVEGLKFGVRVLDRFLRQA